MSCSPSYYPYLTKLWLVYSSMTYNDPSLDHDRFLGNCPSNPPLSQYFALSFASHSCKRKIFAIQLKLKTPWFCLSPDENHTNGVDLVRVVRLSSIVRLLELSKRFQFDYVRLPNQSRYGNPSDWVGLSSIDFWFVFVRLTTPCAWYSLE